MVWLISWVIHGKGERVFFVQRDSGLGIAAAIHHVRDARKNIGFPVVFVKGKREGEGRRWWGRFYNGLIFCYMVLCFFDFSSMAQKCFIQLNYTFCLEIATKRA